MPSKKKTDSEKNYYSDYAEEKNQETNNPGEFPVKKIATILLSLFVIIIVLILAFNLLSQSNNLLFLSGDGGIFKQNVTVSKNGQMIDTFYSDGNNLVLKGNPLDSIKGKISSPILSGGKKNGKITITGSNGRITILNSGEGFFIDENGNINFTVNPSDLIDLDDYYDENTGDYIFPDDFNYSTTFEFIVTDEETGEETIIVAPIDFIFSNQNANSCISLNRSFINESTHYGSLPVNVSLEVTCESYSNLISNVSWESERMGNVELIFGNYTYSSVLTDYNKYVLPLPLEGEYPLKIIFTPFKEAVGKKAYFSVNFTLNGVTSKIDFEVPIDNLEQCVQISSEDLILTKESESVSFKVDVSSCYSDRINVSLCDNDAGCSGGTEGGINLSQYSFQLNPKGNSSKIVSITKDEIAGAYGIPIYARVTGASKVFVDEKTVIVEPFNGETVFPEKFIISTIGTGKDSVVVRNNDLAEEVEVSASVCNIYKSSLGVKTGLNFAAYDAQTLFGESWWRALSSDPEKYAGSGKYQSALFSLIGKLEKKRIETQNESYTRNALIKQSYLMTDDTAQKVDKANIETTTMLTSLNGLKEKLNSTNEMADLDLTSTMVSLATSGTSMYTIFTLLSADIDSALTTTTTMAAVPCGAAQVSAQAALEGVTEASVLSASEMVQVDIAYTIYATIYSLYGTASTMTKDTESINADSALSNTKKALDKLEAAKKEAQIALTFAELSMTGASIDSFYSISSEDFIAKNYLDDVSTHTQNVLDLLTEAQEFQTDALDDITIGIPEVASNTENILQITSMVSGLIATLITLQGQTSKVLAALDASLVSINAAVLAAEDGCAVSKGTDVACCEIFPAKAAIATTAITNTNLTGLATMTEITAGVSLGNTAYSLMRTYQTMSNDYTEDYQTAATEISNLIPKINDAKLAAQALVDFLPTSIDAANWLGVESKKVSDVANYTSEEYGVDGETYNKKRLNGVVGTVLANAFVNGSYQGGVYTKENNSSNLSGFSQVKKEDTNKTKLYFADETNWKEDCDNIVKLTLLDYKINLLQDSQKPILSSQGIVTYWDFSDAKVYDVFEEQTVDLLFANNGVTKNTYGVLELPLIRHIHENPLQVTEKFGPFDIPDTAEPLTYKYHMKFNTVPRKSNNYTKATGANSCGVGILRGETGSTASLPKVVLSWDWNSVNLATNSQIQNNSTYSRKLNSATIGTNSPNEPYIDASQLSILISKKLGSLEYFLENIQTNCPVNPVDEILTKIAPNIAALSQNQNTYASEEVTSTQKCYLPLTTEEYDGKPALYYYLPKTNSLQNSDLFNAGDDIQQINDREEFLTLVDFNAFLMRDGYGIDFQSDFVVSYSSKLFASSFSFVNNQTGLKNYFYDPDRFFFSSKANSLISRKEWTLPDAGKYRIRALIDFDETANLFLSSSPSSKIIILLDLIEPVSSNYSPFYYTPIDGFTGLTANNNRIGYGSSMVGGNDFSIVDSQGAMLSSAQKNSLNKLRLSQASNFFLLNALPSMRSKILEYTLAPTLNNESLITFNPTTATPLLFEIKEIQGNRTLLDYSVSKENSEISSEMNSLFILSKLDGCYEYKGSDESTFINNGPDYGNGKIFGLYLPLAEKDGSNFVKTVAYAPIQSSYYLKKPLTGLVYSPLAPNVTNNDILLSGVPGMKSNNSISGEKVDSLEKIMQGVEAGSICVANLGTREVFFWPEENIFEEKYVGEEFAQKQLSAMNSCIKQAN